MDRDEDLRAAYKRSMEYATPSGRDIESGRTPHTVECSGVRYCSVSSATSADEPTHTPEGIACLNATIWPGEWSIRFYGDYEGPELPNGNRPFSLTAVWIVEGQLRAVFSTCGGGPVGTGPELVREDIEPEVIQRMYHSGEALLSPLNASAGME